MLAVGEKGYCAKSRQALLTAYNTRLKRMVYRTLRIRIMAKDEIARVLMTKHDESSDEEKFSLFQC